MELEVQLKIRDKIILDQQRVLKGKDRKWGCHNQIEL
jgi:hypothetical protein